MAELKSTGVYAGRLATTGAYPSSLGLNTVAAPASSDYTTGHLYWAKNLLGNVPSGSGSLAGATLEFVFGRYGVNTPAYDAQLSGTSGQAVLACFRGDGRTAAGVKISTPEYGVNAGDAALSVAWLWVEHSKSAGSHQLKAYIAPSNPLSATPAAQIVYGPVIQDADHSPDFSQHFAIAFEAVSNDFVVTLHHNGQAGTPSAALAKTLFSHFMLNGGAGYAPDAVLFGPCLTAPAGPSNGYYYDCISYYPTRLADATITGHYSKLFDGLQIPTGSGGAPAILTQDFRVTLSLQSLDYGFVNVYAIQLGNDAASSDVLVGATRTVMPGSSFSPPGVVPAYWRPYFSMNTVQVTGFRTTSPVALGSLVDFVVDLGPRPDVPPTSGAVATFDLLLEYKNASGTWVQLDSRQGEAWPYRDRRVFTLGGAANSTPPLFGFDLAGLTLPASPYGPDDSAFEMVPTAWPSEHTARYVPMKQTHDYGVWFFEINLTDVTVPASSVMPHQVVIGVSEMYDNSGTPTGGSHSKLALEVDASGVVQQMLFSTYNCDTNQSMSWPLTPPIHPLVDHKLIVMVDIGVKAAGKVQVAFGYRLLAGNVYWFDCTIMTFSPWNNPVQTPRYWAVDLPLKGDWSGWVQMQNLAGKVHSNTGEATPMSVPFHYPYMGGWGLPNS